MIIPRGNSILSLCVLLMAPVSSFQPSGRTLSSPLTGRVGYQELIQHAPEHDNTHTQTRSTASSSTSLNMFMGSDGGLLGIGTPELATILLVGYFVLGPSDLYKLVKEIGKFIQNVRTLGNEATKSFETNMESQLELQELRNAQRELNDAFSFRRSINVDDEGGAFSTNAQTPRPQDDIGAPVAAAAAATSGEGGEAAAVLPKRKKKRRRVKKKVPPPVEVEPTMESTTTTTAPPVGNIPDLDMSEAFPADKKEKDWFSDSSSSDDDKDIKLPSASDMAKEDLEWLKESETTIAEQDPAVATAEQSRFQQQMSASWNQQVVDNEDQLAPLAMIMQKLALLEEEKAAADKRLQEEYEQRLQLEEDFYRKKRELLEETAGKVQQDAYVTMDNASKK